MDKRRLLSEMICEIISPYAADEMEKAEIKLSLYPAWKRYLIVMDSIFACSFRDPYADRIQGGVAVPQAERVLELKEEHPEYQRVLRNITKIEEGLATLTYQEIEFVGMYWWEVGQRGDHRQLVADDLGWGRGTVGRWRKKCLRKMMPFLEDVDAILIRARYVEEWGREKNGPVRTT